MWKDDAVAGEGEQAARGAWAQLRSPPCAPRLSPARHGSAAWLSRECRCAAAIRNAAMHAEHPAAARVVILQLSTLKVFFSNLLESHR